MGFQTKIYSSQPGLPAHREVLLQRSSVQLLFSCSVQNCLFSLRKIKVMMLRKASTKTPTKTFQFSENFQVVVFSLSTRRRSLSKPGTCALRRAPLRPAAYCQSRRTTSQSHLSQWMVKNRRLNLTSEVS